MVGSVHVATAGVYVLMIATTMTHPGDSISKYSFSPLDPTLFLQPRLKNSLELGRGNIEWYTQR